GNHQQGPERLVSIGWFACQYSRIENRALNFTKALGVFGLDRCRRIPCGVLNPGSRFFSCRTLFSLFLFDFGGRLLVSFRFGGSLWRGSRHLEVVEDKVFFQRNTTSVYFSTYLVVG